MPHILKADSANTRPTVRPLQHLRPWQSPEFAQLLDESNGLCIWNKALSEKNGNFKLSRIYREYIHECQTSFILRYSVHINIFMVIESIHIHNRIYHISSDDT